MTALLHRKDFEGAKIAHSLRIPESGASLTASDLTPHGGWERGSSASPQKQTTGNAHPAESNARKIHNQVTKPVLATPQTCGLATVGIIATLPRGTARNVNRERGARCGVLSQTTFPFNRQSKEGYSYAFNRGEIPQFVSGPIPLANGAFKASPRSRRKSAAAVADSPHFVALPAVSPRPRTQRAEFSPVKRFLNAIRRATSPRISYFTAQ